MAAPTAEAAPASARAAARAAASLSTPMRKSTMARTSWWVRSAEASTRKVVGSGTARTKDPRPWKVSTRPSARSRVTASRTTVRETAYAAMSSDSEGSFDPGARSPERMRSLSPVTTRWARVVVTDASWPTDVRRRDRQGPHPLAQREAEAGAVRHPHASVADLDPLVEEGVEPLEVLDPRLGRVGGRQVEVDLHRVVRREGQAGVGRQG